MYHCSTQAREGLQSAGFALPKSKNFGYDGNVTSF